MPAPSLCQVAFSVTDLRRTHRWYREVLGFAAAGGTNLFVGPIATRVQGVPRAASSCWWLVDRQEFFQLELFEFWSPRVRPAPPDRRPCDIGYTMVGIHVADLDATLDRLRGAGTPLLGAPAGPAGARRACIRDPEGVLVELMEDDPRVAPARPRPRAGLPVALRSVRLSVPDLGRAARFFVDTLGLVPVDAAGLHDDAREALWGLAGAHRQTLTLAAGDVFVELVQYLEPVGRPRPPGYRISDQGLLNVALGFRDKAAFAAAHARCRAAGYRGNWRPLDLGAWSVVYVNDDDGFSVELLHVKRWWDAPMGFVPRAAPRLAPFVGRAQARTRAARLFGRALVTGATGGIGSELCRTLAADGTALVLLDRDAGRLAALAGELGAAVDVTTQVLDMTDLEAVDTCARALAGGPPIDLVIASAGLDRAQRITRLDWRQARDDFHVNTLAHLVLLAALAPGMAARGDGHVAAIASLAALLGFPYEAAYSGSKAALAAIVESARAELATAGVTCTTVFPGFVDTAMARANAFKKDAVIPARDAAERIYDALLARRPTLYFPAAAHLRVRVARLLPIGLRDRLVRDAMAGPPDGGEGGG